MAAMTPKRELAIFYRWREASIQAVIHLDTLERAHRCEQSQAFRLQTSDALRTPVPAVHGAPVDGTCTILCHIRYLTSAPHSQAVSGRFECFYCHICCPPEARDLVAQPCIASPENPCYPC